MKNKFKESLYNLSMSGVRSVPKSDLHNHAGCGGSARLVKSWTGAVVAAPADQFMSLSRTRHEQKLSDGVTKEFRPGLQSHLKRWRAAFVHAAKDNVKVFSISNTIDEIEFIGGMEVYTKILAELFNEYTPDAVLLPELTINRACDEYAAVEKLDEIFSYQWFRSIDIHGDSSIKPVKNFKRIFRKAKNAALRLKAHVGEYGPADDIMEAVEELGLDEVHHGITAAESPLIMKWLARNKIQLNICPSCNIISGIVENYGSHPIKKIYDAGIPVTINTDDMLIFNQSISQEYMNLYRSGLMSVNDLDYIRVTGLKQINFYPQFEYSLAKTAI